MVPSALLRRFCSDLHTSEPQLPLHWHLPALALAAVSWGAGDALDFCEGSKPWLFAASGARPWLAKGARPGLSEGARPWLAEGARPWLSEGCQAPGSA